MNSGSKIRVVFFGSGPVAAKSLKLLLANFDIEYVVTKKTAPHHKGIVPVMDIVEQQGLPLLAVENKSDLDKKIISIKFDSKVAILVDFGIIVSQKVIDSFKFGIVNSHFSLLPQWRGADPITFAILSGQQQTGVSLMLLVESMDEGPLLAQSRFTLSNNITAPELTERLIKVSNKLLVKHIGDYLTGKLKPYPQPATKTASYSRKLTKSDGILDFTKTAVRLEREIRAYTDWPKSHTIIAGIDVIVTKAHSVPSSFSNTPGEIYVMQDIGALMIQCSSGYLCVEMIKPLGKKEMSVKSFLAGYGQRLYSSNK